MGGGLGGVVPGGGSPPDETHQAPPQEISIFEVTARDLSPITAGPHLNFWDPRFRKSKTFKTPKWLPEQPIDRPHGSKQSRYQRGVAAMVCACALWKKARRAWPAGPASPEKKGARW
jgi:hypothetical protein